MIEQVIEPKLCQIVENCPDWKEAIRTASQPQVNCGYICKPYVDAMIENVEKYGSYIVIAKDIAIAHATPDENCKKTTLGITRFKNPVDFHSNEFGTVKILFTLAAPDSSKHMQLLKELVNGINNEQKVKNLESCNTPMELYSMFLKNSEVAYESN